MASPLQPAEIARNAVWRTIEVTGSELLSFGIMVLLARLLVPEDYGVVAIATALLMIAQMTVYHGFAEAIIQAKEPSNERDSSAFWVNLAVGVFLTSLFMLAAFPLSSMLNKPSLGPILLALAPVTLFFSATGILQAHVRRDLRIKVLAVRTLVSVVAGGGVGIGLAIAGCGAWALVGQQLSHAASGVVILLAFGGWRPKMSICRREIEEMLRFGWFAMLTFLLDVASRNITIVILGFFLAAELIGHFFIANRMFFSLAMLTFMSIGEFALPVLARLRTDPARYVDAIYRSFRLTGLICLPAFLGLAAVAEPVILSLFGQKWAQAAGPLCIIAVFGAAHGFSSLIGQLFLALDRPERAVELTFLTGLLMIGLVTPAASFGLTAAAFAIGAGYLIVLPFAMYRLSSVMPIDWRRMINEQVPIWLATGAMLGIVTGFQVFFEDLAPITVLGVCIVCGAMTYILVIRLTAPDFFAEMISVLQKKDNRPAASVA